MFSMLANLDRSRFVRGVLVTFAVLMLAPGALVVLGLLALMLVPVALIAIPFMLVVFFELATSERHEVRRRSVILTGVPATA